MHDKHFILAMIAIAALLMGAISLADYQAKTYRLACIAAMKDRPTVELLEVCK